MLASITKTDICRHLNKYIYKLQIYHMPCTPLLFEIKDKLLLSLYFCALVETQYLTLRPKCHKVSVSIRSILLLYSAPWVFKKEQVLILVHILNAEWKHELLLLRFELRWPWDPCLHLLPFASSNSNKLEFRYIFNPIPKPLGWNTDRKITVNYIKDKKDDTKFWKWFN